MQVTTSRKAPGVRPGWYRDPTDAGRLRWWSGYVWTQFSMPMPDSRPTPPPQAWYPDPQDPTQRLRWWDGDHWTEKTRDRYPGWPWMLVLLATLLMIYLYFESLSLY